MNRIDIKFKELKKIKKKAFIAYITAGDPSLNVTKELIYKLGKSGVDIIELGIPFSDPMADGLTNQRSAERALSKGVTLKKVFGMIRGLRKKTDIPIILFTYLNPVFRYGWERFVIDAKKGGADGVLVLDLPAEEAEEERRILSSQGIKMIYLISPASTEERIRFICKRAKGFIYYISRTGVTGERETIEKNVRPMVLKIKKYTKVPVAVGFGISKPAHIRNIKKYADAVVVGSAIVNKIEKNIGRKNLLSSVGRFVSLLSRDL